MSIQSRRLNNVLLHWVQRHQSMTTLFHSHPRPVHSTQATQMPLQADSATVIQAKPMDVQTQPQPDLPITQSSPKASAVRQVNPPLPADLASKETKSPTPSTPSRLDASVQPDPGWKRLQTIFRKHQEQENPTTESIKLPENSAETKTHIPPAAEPAASLQTLNNAHQSKTPGVPQPAQIPPVVQRKSNSADVQEVASKHASATPENKVQTLEIPAPPVDQPAAAGIDTSKPEIDQRSDSPNAEIISPSEPSMDFDEPGLKEGPEQPNTLPLEAVWNVQRTEASELNEQPVSRRPQSPYAPGNSATPKTTLQRAELESEVNSSSFQNESKVTEEPIELLTESIMDADITSEMRAPVEILTPSRPRPAPVNPVTQRTAIQKQPQEQPSGPEDHEDRMVETAIGPLPADLWQLIGQKPPEGKPHQPMVHESVPPSVQRQAESAEPHAETIRHETTSQPTTTIKMVDFPATVQRQPAAQDTTSSSEQPGTVSTSSSQQVAESELDVDELARKVYARIRQRLSTEWERLRRK